MQWLSGGTSALLWDGWLQTVQATVQAGSSGGRWFESSREVEFGSAHGQIGQSTSHGPALDTDALIRWLPRYTSFGSSATMHSHCIVS